MRFSSLILILKTNIQT